MIIRKSRHERLMLHDVSQINSAAYRGQVENPAAVSRLQQMSDHRIVWCFSGAGANEHNGVLRLHSG